MCGNVGAISGLGVSVDVAEGVRTGVGVAVNVGTAVIVFVGSRRLDGMAVEGRICRCTNMHAFMKRSMQTINKYKFTMGLFREFKGNPI